MTKEKAEAEVKKKAEKRELDVFDLLPSEAFRSIDELGFSFLSERGYDTTDAIESEEKRMELKTALEANGEELRYFGAFDNETGAILVWYELYRGEERLAVSRGLKFLPREKEAPDDRQ